LTDMKSTHHHHDSDLVINPTDDRADTALVRRLTTLIDKERGRPEVVKLDGDASTRSYYRMLFQDGSSAILMQYPEPATPDLASFLDVHAFLAARGLPVPKIHSVFPTDGLVILEDLGDDLLETLVEQSTQDRIFHLYTQAVDLLLTMRRVTRGVRSGCVAFQLAFDLKKLMQEMEFFMTHFVRGLCKTQPSQATSHTIERFFSRICGLLASEPRILTHRDYHSRNLMVHKESLVMIDFQDARMGPAQYDLASLLRDSYVTLPDELVDALVERYREGMEHEAQVSADRFRYVFDVMSLQRNIKALGTFGYQISARGSRRYVSSIPRTGSYVARNIAMHDEFSSFRAVVNELVCAPSCEITRYLGA
jgi:N-acetylmuramate 1-kinase